MKHLFILFVIAAIFSSCKKDKQADNKAGAPAFTKNLIEQNMTNGNSKNFSYNAANRIISYTTNSSATSYQQEAAFSMKQTYNSYGYIYELKNTVRNAMGKIVTADRYYNGVLQMKFSFTYNAEGFLVKMISQRTDIVSITELNYFYEAGNLAKITDHGNGKLRNTYLYEYDLSVLNPFKLDLFEFNLIGFLTDDQFGRLSKNLVKKETILDEHGNLYRETQFAFVMDAEGYPVSLKELTTNTTTTHNFKFQ